MFFTIGHSTRSLEEFLTLLHTCKVEQLVDVRKLPGSRSYPHFDSEPLADALRNAGVGYERPEPLTGRRPVSHDIPFETNAWWQNRSFHNYADHALSTEFQQGLSALRDTGRTQPTAIMCSEAVWWRCHRRIIADHLLAHREEVSHIIDAENVSAASLSAGATVDAEGIVTYPATG